MSDWVSTTTWAVAFGTLDIFPQILCHSLNRTSSLTTAPRPCRSLTLPRYCRLLNSAVNTMIIHSMLVVSLPSRWRHTPLTTTQSLYILAAAPLCKGTFEEIMMSPRCRSDVPSTYDPLGRHRQARLAADQELSLPTISSGAYPQLPL